MRHHETVSGAGRRAFLQTLAAGVAALLVAGPCATGARAADRTPYRFGLAMPLTGSQALYGADQTKAAQWAVDDINASGGVNGRPLEMIVLDTQANPQLGINAANRLISVEKVPAFVTAWSAVVSAVAPIANRSKVLELSVGANSPSIAELGDYVYTTYPLADVDITAVAKYSYATMGKRRAAVLYINNDTGVYAARVYRDVFEKAGGKVVAFESYEPTATDYTGALLKIRASGPEIIHIQGLVSDTPQVIAQLRQLGIQTPISSYSAAYNPKLVQQLGAAAEGLIVTSLAPGPADSPAVKAYVERWQKAEGRVPNGLPYTQYLYDAPYLVKATLEWLEKRKLPITGENMRRALVEIGTYDLPLTGRTVIAKDHTVRRPVFLLKVEKGAFVPLATVE
jgi:branched-chain amino acid transport system substrate-binding protein